MSRTEPMSKVDRTVALPVATLPTVIIPVRASVIGSSPASHSYHHRILCDYVTHELTQKLCVREKFR